MLVTEMNLLNHFPTPDSRFFFFFFFLQWASIEEEHTPGSKSGTAKLLPWEHTQHLL